MLECGVQQCSSAARWLGYYAVRPDCRAAAAVLLLRTSPVATSPANFPCGRHACRNRLQCRGPADNQTFQCICDFIFCLIWDLFSFIRNVLCQTRLHSGASLFCLPLFWTCYKSLLFQILVRRAGCPGSPERCHVLDWEEIVPAVHGGGWSLPLAGEIREPWVCSQFLSSFITKQFTYLGPVEL